MNQIFNNVSNVYHEYAAWFTFVNNPNILSQDYNTLILNVTKERSWSKKEVEPQGWKRVSEPRFINVFCHVFSLDLNITLPMTIRAFTYWKNKCDQYTFLFLTNNTVYHLLSAYLS